MSLVALDGTPLVVVGGIGRDGAQSSPSATNTLIDAANEACIFIGQIFTEDGGSHTIDTTGSSSIGWRAGSVTFANAGTTVIVGLATVDTTAGPPARAVNVADVITFDVSKTMVGGGGGITANAWQTHVPDAGTKTVANGDFIAMGVQATARAGVDLVNVTTGSSVTGSVRPSVTSFTGGAYANVQSYPNAVITFSDGKLGWFYGALVWNTLPASKTWNNGSVIKEYGNYFQLPVPGKIYGITYSCAPTGDMDVVLYSDPLGTAVAEKTVSFDLNAVGAGSSSRWSIALFASPYTFAANQPLAGIIKPTTVTDVVMPYLSLFTASHAKAFTLGANCYAINRNAGAFAAQSTVLDRFGVGLIIGAWDAGGGSSGYPASRMMAGM